MILRIKDLLLDVYVHQDTKKRGWSIRFTKPNRVDFTSDRIYREDELILELSRHYRFFKRRMTVLPKEYSKSIHFLGVEYEIVVVESDLRKMILLGDKAYLYTDTEDYGINKSIVNAFYEENLRDIIERNLEKAKAAMNITFPIEISYKTVKTYYGECIPKKRRMIFQQSLAKYEEIFILSVLYHELAHFYYMNHQEGFYRLLESVFPNYRAVQAALRRTKYNDMY